MRQSSAGPAPRSDGPPPPSPPSSDLAEGLAVPEHPHSAQPGGGKDRGGGGGCGILPPAVDHLRQLRAPLPDTGVAAVGQAPRF